MRPPGFSVTFAVLLALCAFLSSRDGLAQTVQVTGTVKEEGTGEPLVGANIVVLLGDGEGRVVGDVSDIDGAFSVRDVPVGIHRLTVSYAGYESFVLPQLKLEPGVDRQISVVLARTTIALDDIVVITASRQRERALSAPAAVSVVDAEEIRFRPNLSLTEHLKVLPGLDVVDSGLFHSNVYVRGFVEASDAGRFLLLTDYRIASTPSFRVNAFPQLAPLDADIERMELVAGPGSALYGPNAVSGVLHVITRSPFDSRGTTLSVEGGGRDVIKGTVRHAGVVGDAFGYKVSGHYFRGSDWESSDPAEPDSIVKGLTTPDGRVPVSALIPNSRDFDIEKIGTEATLEYRGEGDLRVVLTGGFTRVSALNVIDLGGLQIVDWDYSLVQARLHYKDLFAQVFYNQNNTGDTYFLRSGDLVRDKSRMWVAQVQHATSLLDGRQRFRYGVDALLTRPRSENTVFGRNEDDDAINEVGAYVQSETDITSMVRLVAAGRLDEQNVLEDPVFSPRVGLVVTPDPSHTFRLTFNRAYKSVGTLDLFIDINVVPMLGPFPYAVRVRGVPPETGFTFRRDENGGLGGLYMQSPFTPAAVGGPSAYLPADATLAWGAVVGFLQSQGVDLSDLPPPTVNDVETVLATLDPNTQSFVPVSPSAVADVPPLEPLRITTFEAGYRGVIGDRLLLTANIYREQNENFLGPTLNETPNVFLEANSLGAYLGRFMPAGQAAGLAGAISTIPLGTITPEQGDAGDILLTTRSFGKVTHYGAELGASVFADANWSFGGSYSWLSDNYFERETGEPRDISLNAPRHKFGGWLRYDRKEHGVSGQVRFRYVDGFPIISGLGNDDLPSYALVDLAGSYRLPITPNVHVALSIQNLLDNRHREFIGVPEIGRLVLLRLQYSM